MARQGQRRLRETQAAQQVLESRIGIQGFEGPQHTHVWQPAIPLLVANLQIFDRALVIAETDIPPYARDRRHVPFARRFLETIENRDRLGLSAARSALPD